MAARVPQLAELREQRGHRRQRCADHRQVGCGGQTRDVGVGQHTRDGLVLRVDGHHRAVEATPQQVAHDHRAHGVAAVRGPDHRDRLGPEEGIEISHRHGANLRWLDWTRRA